MENNTPNTNNFLNWVEIKNFKSIKDLRLACKRVNVFIGKPNVGKSNILEGLGLLGAGYTDIRFLVGLVRFKKLKSLFYDSDTSKHIEIVTDKGALLFEETELYELIKNSKDFKYSDEKATFRLTTLSIDTYKVRSNHGGAYSLEEDSTWLVNEPALALIPGKIITVPGPSEQLDFNAIRRVKKYDYAGLVQFDKNDFRSQFSKSLQPPDGPNLYSVIRGHNEIWKEFAALFSEQGLELVLFDESQEFLLQKKIGPQIWQYPFFSIADTFRRFMFYITAIESNKNSVIVFEEPEVHSFPPYTQDIAYRMIYSEENQFFVSTHSPYLLQTLVSNLNDEQLNVFVTYYEDYQTKVKALTAEELSFVQEYSTDVFFNLDRFIPNAQSANPA